MALNVRIKVKKIAGPLILKKILMKRKKVSKKGFLIKENDFQEKNEILETKLFTVLILCSMQSTLGKSVSHVEIKSSPLEFESLRPHQK